MVVILRLEGQVIGLIVSEVHDVEAIATQDITSDLDDRYISRSERQLICGLAKYNNDIVTLLNPLALPLRQANQAMGQASVKTVGVNENIPSNNDFLAQFPPEQQQVLRDRATSLMQLSADQGFAGLAALAVVSLEGERFALGLESVHEFTDVTQITPIPCCPGYIVGNMNLRGEILTLVDVRSFLNLAPTPDRQSKKSCCHAS